MELFKYQNAVEYVHDLQGYKLSNTHFKIGGKYHTDTFVHAKVLLHNSFYTSRLALSIADTLFPLLVGKKTLSLVGYERYSELLIGQLKHFLKAKDPDLTISSCIMVDQGERLDLFGSQEHFSDYVVIVPIVSTGSTTNRIIASYKSQLSGGHDPLHVFHVLHLRPRNRKKVGIKNCTTLISQELKWFVPHKCEKCFDEKQAQALLEADKSNLNPIVVFEKPSVKIVHPITAKDVKPTERSYVGEDFTRVEFKNSLLYLQDNNNQGPIKYSHKTDVFINDNRKKIEKWLDDVKSRFRLKPTDKVVILSPCQNNETNLPFVNLVNEKVFGSSATIIYHEADREYPENFKLLNYDFLRKDSSPKDSIIKVFYVDDDLVSGRSFFTIYDLFRYSTEYSGIPPMVGAIFLMNKASENVNQRIIRAAKTVHSFVAVNIPQYYSVGQTGSFDREIQRYESFAKKSLSYAQEKHFIEKRNRLASVVYDKNKGQEIEGFHLQMFYATHSLFDLFAKENDWIGWTFDKLFQECYKKDPRLVDRYAVISELSWDTFTMYQPLKDKVFEWNKSFLDKTEQGIKERVSIQASLGQKGSNDPGSNNGNPPLNKNDLEHLCLLIRRSVLVGNYHLIQKPFLEFLDSIFVYLQEFPERIASHDIQVFEYELLNNYCELIFNNMACAPLLTANLKNIEFKTARGLSFRNKVLDEAAIVLEDLYKYMAAMGLHRDIKETMKNADSNSGTKAFNAAITKWLEKSDIRNRVDVAEEVMSIKSTKRSLFYNYLFVKHLFYSDKEKDNNREKNIKADMDKLFSHLKRFINGVDGMIGAFFVVRDVSGKLRLVYDRNKSGSAILRTKFRSEFFQNYLRDFNSSQDREVLTYIESTNCSEDNKEFLKALGDKIKCLVLMHIGSADNKEADGIVAFYSEKKSIEPDGLRYLLLLRRDLQFYISEHHKNDEFVALLQAENRKRFAYLSGHGREMMQELAKNYDSEVGPIVSTMERVQGIFLDNDSKNKIGTKDFDYFFKPTSLDKKALNHLLYQLESLAAIIYEGRDLVEWNEAVKINKLSVTMPENQSIYFNDDLLRFICFELIVNAKKNRFFKTEDFDDSYPGVTFESNELEFGVIVDDEGFEIRVMGTGPRVWDSTMTAINDHGLIKERDDISGLDLILHLIQVFDYTNRIDIHTKRYRGPVHHNTVIVRINHRNKVSNSDEDTDN